MRTVLLYSSSRPRVPLSDRPATQPIDADASDSSGSSFFGRRWHRYCRRRRRRSVTNDQLLLHANYL